MRAWIRTLAVAALIVPLAGCFTLSVNSLYDQETVHVDDALIGLWGDPEDPEGETWEFQRLDEDSYRLIVREKNTLRIDPERDGIFEAHLVRLGELVFLDLYPEEPETGNEFYRSHAVPAHSFWKADLQGNVMLLSIMENRFLKESLEAGTIQIEHVEHEGALVLTAPTARLQALVTEYTAELFQDSETMTKLQ